MPTVISSASLRCIWRCTYGDVVEDGSAGVALGAPAGVELLVRSWREVSTAEEDDSAPAPTVPEAESGDDVKVGVVTAEALSDSGAEVVSGVRDVLCAAVCEVVMGSKAVVKAGTELARDVVEIATVDPGKTPTSLVVVVEA